MTDYLECPTQVDLDAALNALRQAEDDDVRALVTKWYSDPLEPCPDWYKKAGRPAPPGVGQGTDFKPGVGWVRTNRLPKRVLVLPLPGRAGACVAVSSDRAGQSPVSRSGRPVKSRAELGPEFAAVVNAREEREKNKNAKHRTT